MLQSLKAVQAFLDANAARLGDSVNAEPRRRLDGAVAELATHVAVQEGSHLDAKGATQQQQALRKVLLREHMAPIAKIAAADLPVTPAVKPLRMPSGRPRGERLAALAYGMAETAAKYPETFTKGGLSVDFVARLKAAADAMVATLGDRTKSRGYRRGATEGLKSKLSKGRKVVAILDSFVQIALKDDAPLLAEWNTVKRVQGIPRASAASAPVSSQEVQHA